GGAGPPLPVADVRAAMAVRAGQLAAGGAGVCDELLLGLVAALNNGVTPFTRAIGSLGTGDLGNLADVALALLGEGRAWHGGRLVDAGDALAQAGLAIARLGPRDGLAFMSSNAFSVGAAALLAVDALALHDAAMAVAALSFAAVDADPVVLDARVHPPAHRPGQAAVAERMRRLLGSPGQNAPGQNAPEQSPPARERPVQDPFPFRAQPQVDGVLHESLEALVATLTRELGFAGENALVIAEAEGTSQVLPNANFHAAALASALDGVRAALAAAAGLVAARVSALLDARLSGLPQFLALDPGPDSGALILEYTVHAVAAEVRSAATPATAQWASVSGGVESHASFAPMAARRGREALDGLRLAVAAELVTAVRALRLSGREPAGESRALWEAARLQLNPELTDRPLHDDVEAARALLAGWRAGR
ncbi:MAG: aromatic amino acid ammonia-lyase, partial [Solirubrobacteraceae bacterium]